MLIQISASEAHTSIRDSLRCQLLAHGYHATDYELEQMTRNLTQAVISLDTTVQPIDAHERLIKCAKAWRKKETLGTSAALAVAIDAVEYDAPKVETVETEWRPYSDGLAVAK